MAVFSKIPAFYRIYRPYFTLERDNLARIFFLASMLLLNIANGFCSVLLDSLFDNVLGIIEVAGFSYYGLGIASGYFLAALALSATLGAVAKYFSVRLGDSLNNAMQNSLLGKWFQNNTFFKHNQSNTGKIPADIIPNASPNMNFMASFLLSDFLEVSCEAFSALVSLWFLSTPLTVSFFSISFILPHFLFFSCMSYGFIYNAITSNLATRLKVNIKEQQGVQAKMTRKVEHITTNSQAIALTKGSEFEQKSMYDKMRDFVQRSDIIAKCKGKLAYFNFIHHQGLSFIVLMLSLPSLIEGAIKPMKLTMITQRFRVVTSLFTWFSANRSDLTELEANLDRITDFQNELDRVLATQPRLNREHKQDANSIIFKDVNVVTFDGNRLLHKLNSELKPGERVLLKGPSGSGKTTLLLSVAGLSNTTEGYITLPTDENIVFVPQIPYIPQDTNIYEIVAYPFSVATGQKEQISALMRAFKLNDRIIESADEKTNWEIKLSPGEKQRLSIIRALIRNPKYLIMDEPTSAIDANSKKMIEDQIVKQLPKDGILFYIDHAPTVSTKKSRSITTLYNRVLDVEANMVNPPAEQLTRSSKRGVRKRAENSMTLISI